MLRRCRTREEDLRGSERWFRQCYAGKYVISTKTVCVCPFIMNTIRTKYPTVAKQT